MKVFATMAAMKDIIIIGSGLAGMSAAIEAIDRGYRPIILERNAQLGGRTSSWIEDGMPVESGLHRFLGVYKALPDLIHRVGLRVDEIVTWEDEVEIRLPGEKPAVFGASPLHRPIKSFKGLLEAFKILSAEDMASLTSFFAAGIKDHATKPDELDQISVADYAKLHNVSERAFQAVLIPLTSGIFFLPPEQYSAYALFGLINPYAARFHRLRVGAFRGGMSEVLIEPMARYVEIKGGEVHTDAAVTKLIIEDGRVVGARTEMGDYYADYVVLAASLAGAQSILKASKLDKTFADLLKLPSMPVVTMQIELSEPGMEVDHTTFGPLTAWASFAEQSRTTFSGTDGRMSIILTPPVEFVKTPPENLLEHVITEGERIGIHLRDKILRYRKILLPMDFYSLEPGKNHLRPSQKTPISGLALAGDYTQQKYLGTMEGAVVSGKLGIEALLD